MRIDRKEFIERIEGNKQFWIGFKEKKMNKNFDSNLKFCKRIKQFGNLIP